MEIPEGVLEEVEGEVRTSAQVALDETFSLKEVLPTGSHDRLNAGIVLHYSIGPDTRKLIARAKRGVGDFSDRGREAGRVLATALEQAILVGRVEEHPQVRIERLQDSGLCTHEGAQRYADDEPYEWADIDEVRQDLTTVATESGIYTGPAGVPLLVHPDSLRQLRATSVSNQLSLEEALQPILDPVIPTSVLPKGTACILDPTGASFDVGGYEELGDVQSTSEVTGAVSEIQLTVEATLRIHSGEGVALIRFDSGPGNR